MTAKEVLSECRNIIHEIRAIDQQVKPPSIKHEQMLSDKRRKAVELLLKFEKLLDALPNATDRAILRHYYGAGWTDERIAEEMDYNDRTIRDKRKKAIAMLPEL